MASVTYEHVTKRFGDVVAVNDLNISIADREFLVFVGPSGCGKTTSLRMLAGLEEVTEGNIYIGDRIVNDVPPKDRDIAMVFQSYALYPHMSVYDNMAFGLKLRRVPKAEIDQRVREAARRLGIEALLDRKPKQLSGGQRQRVAVGRAIVRNPAVFLMDEPLSNLDAKLRVQARAEISKLHMQLGTTFIYVTHDQVEAMTMGTRIAVMKDGVLQQIDTPQVLYDRPDNVFVAGFIGSPSMNFFDATLTSSGGDLYVDTGAFRVKVPENKVEPYRAHVGKQVIFGIRPEDIHDPEYAPPGIHQAIVESKVDVTELMGNEVIVYLMTSNNKPFLARVDPRTKASVGNTMGMAFNLDNMHIFDKQTEKAIR
ncbi:MAG: glycerol-3-phosphate ABC transporter ATP-binding protein [Candidatus Thermofonsia Clade 3 bacterium]|jgi:multiple sugar transport system ATP-binding protein|uniref:Glycerol-3-phosphate ABC transporter ATP-binding protein n=1 Tax=Candidatus Thermofonsia Clade 3 bacterium TaxID=2364212 RepID=A0A2M8QBA3_9CHLR|nr:ABC transporter ATP-binding protein [Candidatus Roseilinea sp. NK_OTU-006]PJF47077.1 MAG: glycerol-3-phosphate ABC transporter ATP-binding protein [Candidatus Thermofonsia Clade 3 bacterium]